MSWADSVLLCNVTEIRGLEVVRGGTGGGAFLLLTAERKGKSRKKCELRMIYKDFSKQKIHFKPQ